MWFLASIDRYAPMSMKMQELKKKPMLILANKMDLTHAMQAEVVASGLSLDKMDQREWQVCAISAQKVGHA